jgi:uncharacterized membrane protein
MDLWNLGLWVFDFLVMQLLPILSILLVVYFIYKILDAGRGTAMRFMSSVTKGAKRGR